MNISFLPQNEVFWRLDTQNNLPLRQSIETDVVIVGGGMAGLSAAQSFREHGMRVVVLEKNFCGSGATGKSSGFVTPSSELSLDNLVYFYGTDEAKKLWDFVLSGVNFIRNNIQKYNLDCDYQEHDTLILANNNHGFKSIVQHEYKARNELGYTAHLYDHNHVQKIIGSNNYQGGVSYGGSFGINAYHYCLEMKKVLQNLGVTIYEDSPVVEVKNHEVQTDYASVKAQYIVVCVDRFLPSLGKLTEDVFQAQTFLMVSHPLIDSQIKAIFPEKKYMVWDTDLIYNYFRLAGDNRLMLGGSSLLTTYMGHKSCGAERIMKKLTHSFFKKFSLKPSISFEYMWPGLIGVSKDLLPIAGRDEKMDSVYYIAAATGLPWAAALGNYSVESIINNNQSLDHYFSPYRKYMIGQSIQSLLGNSLTYSISNFLRLNNFK